MRKDIFLPSLALAGGIGGFFLRRWQLASAYVPETGLFTRGAPATFALLGLLALLALAFALLTRHKEGPEDFLPAFRSPEAGQMAALVISWLLMTLAGSLGMMAGFKGLRLWRAAPDMYQLSVPVSQLLTGGLCVLGGFGVLYMGRMAYRERLGRAECWFAPFPAFAALIWLFACHLQHGTEPVLMKYGFQLAAALALTLAHYFLAGFLFGRPRRHLTLFLSLLGPAVGITALADRPDWFTSAALAAFSLSALTFARALLRNTFGPPWPERMPPVEEENMDDA
ncbi:hypothetical protein D1641_09320 [Colidextribacter sp. OB.20]|uniref:hypothetical protein n=1 Tax=Colidextribacter sp. OB.20 TaxID=2304568 RepID=UPI001369D415|nr:hypothetical protein [Colidextribacter sp. OB.20]NBI10209.1 hypothetical protein [Colidextribacter sp. OB.20]